MIRPDAYNAGFYNAAMPRIAVQKAAAEDAMAAADFTRILNEAAPAGTTAPQSVSPSAPETEGHSFLGFIKDIIDVINPLQHIPVISAIYRHITGDEISPMAHLAGDAIYGGPIGGAIALADIAYQKTTGKDIGETMIAALTNGKNKNPAETMIAQNLNERIYPADGGQNISGIIWDTPATVSRLSLTPALLTPTGTNGKEPVPHSTPTPAPVLEAKDDVITTLQPLTASKVDSTTVLHPQEAPAGTSRTDVPPELIAVKMMEALDKYQQMKSTQMATVISGTY